MPHCSIIFWLKLKNGVLICTIKYTNWILCRNYLETRIWTVILNLSFKFGESKFIGIYSFHEIGVYSPDFSYYIWSVLSVPKGARSLIIHQMIAYLLKFFFFFCLNNFTWVVCKNFKVQKYSILTRFYLCNLDVKGFSHSVQTLPKYFILLFFTRQEPYPSWRVICIRNIGKKATK